MRLQRQIVIVMLWFILILKQIHPVIYICTNEVENLYGRPVKKIAHPWTV